MLTNAFSQLLFYKPKGKLTNYVISLTAIGMAVVAEWLLFGFDITYLGFLFWLYTAILVSGVIGGLYSGLSSIAFSLVLLLIYSLINPQLRATGTQEIQTLVFILSAFITSYVVSAVKSTYQITISILNNLQTYTVILDPKGHIIDVNQTTLQAMDLQRSTLVGRSILSDFGVSYSNEARNKLRTALTKARQGFSSRFDIKLTAPNNRILFLDFSLAPIFDRQKNVISLVASGNDISARVQSEKKALKLNQTLEQKLQELKASQSKFRALLNANLIGVLVATLDDESRILEANDAFCTMTGYTQADIKAGKVSKKSITPPEYWPQDQAARKELRDTGEVRPYEKVYIRHDGVQIPILIGAAVADNDQSTYVAFILDISARKRLEKRKDEFIGLASHELKTPLTSMKVFIQLLQRSLTSSKGNSTKEYISKMDRQIDRLTTLVEELLDVSKIEAGQLQLTTEPFDVNHLALETINEIEAVSQHHTFSLKGSVKSPVNGDVFRVKQVLLNLLTNAIKYSPQTSKVTIKLKETTDQVIVSVTDTGAGIPELDQKRVFEKFFRASGKNKHSFPGLGLGLYLSKQIIERHRGRMWLQSIEGQKSTFYFSLPKL